MPSGILPDAGLLSGVDGQPKLPGIGRVARVARGGLVAATATVVVTAPVRGGVAALAVLPSPLLGLVRAAALAALAACALVFAWCHRRLRLAPGPLRYSCTFDAFSPAPGRPPPPGTASLHHDLAGLLVSRYPRLGVGGSPRGAGTAADHAVRVGGVRLLRAGTDGAAHVEVRPTVRVGRARAAGLARPAAVRMAGEELAPDELALLADRVCASVAEELYRQLAEHAGDELAFLPTGHLRARGLWHEAADHARSGTVSAHRRARRLYELAAGRLGAAGRPLPPSGLRRTGALVALGVARGAAYVRRVGARAHPPLADRDVLWARCQVGSAVSLVHERILSGFPGRHPTTVYEAQPLVRTALSRLRSLPPGVPGRDAGLADGHAALALVLACLGDRPGARGHLERTEAADPARAGRDTVYLLAAAESDDEPGSRLRRLRRAAAVDARSPAAQWRLALETERRWRSAEHLDPTEAGRVVAEYRRLLALDPGHLGAWASIAQIHWLLDEVPDAADTLVAARGARTLGAGTFLAELELVGARVAAESGRFDEAYHHARDGIAGLLDEGVPQLPDGAPRSYGDWWFSGSPAAVERGRRYRDHVSRQLARERVAGRWSPAVLAAVDAFAWHDLGECLRYAGRTDEARAAFAQATEADPAFVPAHLQLCDLHRRREDEARAAEAAAEIARQEPAWVSGALARALNDAARATAAHRRAARAARAATASAGGRTALERRRLELGLRGAPNATAGATLMADAERLEGRLREQRRASERHAGRAREAARDVRATVPAVVPHGWLWRRADGDRDLDWMALQPPDPRHDRRWERQLGEHHAVALFLYAHTWLRFPPEGVREELAYQRAAALLRCVRERFLPRNRKLLVDLLLAEAAVGAPARVADLVADVAMDADGARVVLAGVLDPENDGRPEWQADVIAAGCEQPAFGPALSVWMAHEAVTRLLPRVDGDRSERLAAAARTAFLRGLRSPDAADLLVVGDGLSRLCEPEHAAAAYRGVIAAGDGDREAPAPAHRAVRRLAATEFVAGRWTPSDGEPPPGDGGAGLTRAEIADAVGRELADASERPCADAAALEAGYEYARLWVAAERETAARAQDRHAWLDAESARLALVAARPPSALGPASLPKPATRLAVETLPDLAGEDGASDASGPQALRTAAEAACREVERRFGVPLPAVVWRPADHGVDPGGYTLLVDGIPVAAGRVDRGASSVGHQLAECLEERLPAFLGVQEVRRALETWVADGGRPGRAGRERAIAEIGTGAELRTVTVCLRALVAEQVPIVDLDALVDAYRRGRPEAGSTGELVGRLRQAVRDRLPGNAPGWEHLRLPADLESDIRRVLGSPDRPAVPARDLEPTLAALRALLDGTAGEVAVITESSLRSVVSWLVSLDRPRVPVLSLDEVAAVRLPDEPARSSAERREGKRREGKRREGERAP